jgi:hypothetical protein
MNRSLKSASTSIPSDLNRLHDQAHAEALALRAQAMDDFWRGADALLAGAAGRVERSARRFGHAWRRHRQAGVGTVGTPAACGGTRQG